MIISNYSKGEFGMYHELSQSEIDRFIKRYFYPYEEFRQRIQSISCISYKGVYECLINRKYILRIYNDWKW